MSKGIYTILQRMNSRQDVMLTATEYLNQRLNKIYKQNLVKKVKDACPSLNDVLQSHCLYTVSEYRPHVAVVYEYFKTSKEGGGGAYLYDSTANANRVRFCLKGNNGDFIHDMVVRIAFQDIGSASSAVRFRYCDIPGLRLFKRVVLKVDNVELDEFTSEDGIFDYRFDLDTSKHPGYLTNMGQEKIEIGEYYNDDLSVKQVMMFKEGAQTFKALQSGVELWIPLRFWFNVHVGQSLHNTLIKTDDKYIEIELENITKIVQAMDANGNVLPDYFKNSKLNINAIDLYTRNIYINPEIHDILCRRRLVSVIRIRRHHAQTINKSTGNILFSQMKYPIEHLTFGFRPDSNLDDFQKWYRFAKITRKEFPVPVIINNNLIAPIQQLVVRTATYDICEPVIDLLGLSIYGNTIYPMTPEKFFNSYLSYVTPDCNSTDECGLYMINLSHFRNKFANTGYLNNSEAREVYLNYVGEEISAANPVLFYSVARCINFLIYTKGSIKLQYIT